MEDSMPVLKLLWEIGLALLVLRLAFFYYSLTYLTRCILAFVRTGILVRLCNIREPTAELFEMPFMLLAVTFWARFIVTKFKIPMVAWIRLAVGLVGMVYMLVTEFVGRAIMRAEGWRKRWLEKDLVVGGALATSLVIFGLMPWLMMLLEGNKIHDQNCTPSELAASLSQLSDSMSANPDIVEEPRTAKVLARERIT